MKKIEQLDALIFIDTNILLDFYRIRTSDVSLKYLEKIEENMNRLITGDQVAMEYKKNRQKVILESLSKFKNPDWNSLTPPAILSSAQPVKIINDKKKEIISQQNKLKTRIEGILARPQYNDDVYKVLQRIFKNNSEYNLDREKKDRFKIRNLAKKRFLLGYPPRKKDDNSIGDAINWEWIIECAIRSGKDIVLVSRDTDFGASFNNESYLNDWLKQEFSERVGKKRKIILTDKLAYAFKLVDIVVTKAMEEEEDQIIKSEKGKLIMPKNTETDFFERMKKYFDKDE
ncbi:MAG: DUF4935 domain-containing protein [Bacteroidota bacterium]|nr:MAG: DUF4935 domain-containing protein [Bacteroidota bacterium]